MPVSGGVYLPAFGATPLRTVIPAFGATPQYYSYKEPNDCTADCNLNVNSAVVFNNRGYQSGWWHKRLKIWNNGNIIAQT